MTINILLFVLTIGSTYFVGGYLYSIAIMAILLAHEMGHYVTSRRYGLRTSLPYFIPFPFFFFGTMGAFIKSRGPFQNRTVLFDVGIAGPLAGFIVALPFTFIGLRLSTIGPVPDHMYFVRLSEPILFTIFKGLFFGAIPDGHDVMLHPLAYAGWLGLFVTGLNLLPAGQLDGGHIVFAVFGRKSSIIYLATIIIMTGLAVFVNPSLLAIIILLFIFGMHHPEPVEMEEPIDTRRIFLAIGALIIFILSFTPIPIVDINLGEHRGFPV